MHPDHTLPAAGNQFNDTENVIFVDRSIRFVEKQSLLWGPLTVTSLSDTQVVQSFQTETESVVH